MQRGPEDWVGVGSASLLSAADFGFASDTLPNMINPAALPFRWKLDSGVNVTIRPIRPDDADIEQDFVRSLSLRSRFFRFFTSLKELSPTALEKFAHNEYPTNVALIATIDSNGKETEIGVARFAPGSRDGWFEFAIVVADEWQGRGIATQLLQQLFTIAEEAGAKGIEGSVLKENQRMLALAKSLGFSVCPDHEDPGIACVLKAFG